MSEGSVRVLLGAQWGDEGKGKLIDILSAESDIGGNNAGHTVVVKRNEMEITHHFHLLPAGAVNPETTLVIGNGCVIHLGDFFSEIHEAITKDTQLHNLEERLLISPRAHIGSLVIKSKIVIRSFTPSLDVIENLKINYFMNVPLRQTSKLIQGLSIFGFMTKSSFIYNNSIGTTKKGIGPCYESKIEAKAARVGLRIRDFVSLDWKELSKKYEHLYNHYDQHYSENDYERDELFHKEFRDRLKRMVRNDISRYLSTQSKSHKRILIEGANGAMLDIDFGTYPYVTSSNCTVGGCITGLGIPPTIINQIIGVMKAYTTRVGDGPFPTELSKDMEVGMRLQTYGKEFGVTTGRVRRCGWLDLAQMRHSVLINGFTELVMTKLDTLSCVEGELLVCREYRRDDHSDDYPDDCETLARVTPIYDRLEGWHSKDLTYTRSINELPKQVIDYVNYVENQLNVPIRWLGVGPERSQLLSRNSNKQFV